MDLNECINISNFLLSYRQTSGHIIHFHSLILHSQVNEVGRSIHVTTVLERLGKHRSHNYSTNKEHVGQENVLVNVLIVHSLLRWRCVVYVFMFCSSQSRLKQSTGNSLSHRISLATEPGVLPVGPGDKGHLSGHFCIVDALAVLMAPPPPFSARLLKVSLALHRFNDAVLGQQPENI